MTPVKPVHFLSAFSLFFILAGPSLAETHSRLLWDFPKKVDENTVFLGEKEREAQGENLQPQPGDKNYAWYVLEKGNNFLLAGHFEKAAAFFAKGYEVSGPTRVLSGFKLIEANEKLGRFDEAVVILEDMKQKYLVSVHEFGEATRLRAQLEDEKRKSTPTPKLAKVTGGEWLLELQPKRMKYVLEAMEVLRAHGVPLKGSAQKYTFRLDEYFIANPDEPADNPAEVLAAVIYEVDSEARVFIDRWRLDPQGFLTPDERVPKEKKTKLIGDEWIRLTHKNKVSYVLDAMEVLKNQNVPMVKSPDTYAYEVDELFTEKPELSAADSVVTLASILYDTEPEAREVLEAIRFQ